jgi:phosphate transport system substrate-binding protein
MPLRRRFAPVALGLVWSLALGCDKTSAQGEAPAATSGGSAPGEPAPHAGAVRVSGSSALLPLIRAAKEKFEAREKGVQLEVAVSDSKRGLADVESGAAEIGASEIFAGPDHEGLVDHKVSAIGFAAIANKGAHDERIGALDLDQLAKIFTGELKNWKELGGGSQPIVVINRPRGSGARSVFGNVILGGDRFVEAPTEDDAETLALKLKQTPGAISYSALTSVHDDVVTFSVKMGAEVVTPTADAITSGKYPIWAYEHLYTKGEAKGETKKFLDLILSPDFQTTSLRALAGFIPIASFRIQKAKN